MYDDLTSKYNATSTTTTFGNTTAQKYEGSTLDTYLNTTWYNTLTSAAKAAIVPENVVQYCYKYYDEPNTPNTPTYTYQYQYNWSDSDYENADNVGNVTVGERNIFALDLKDIFDYIGKVCITSDELMTMFWNSTAEVSKYLWLRSSYADSSIDAWGVGGGFDFLGNYDAVDSYVVRPAFNINLSQIPFTKKKGETWIINDFSSPTAAIIDNIEFTSNSKIFTKITISYESKVMSYLLYDSEEVASIHYEVDTENWSTNWTNSAYRTITLAFPATGDLLAWLQANAVKQ